MSSNVCSSNHSRESLTPGSEPWDTRLEDSQAQRILLLHSSSRWLDETRICTLLWGRGERWHHLPEASDCDPLVPYAISREKQAALRGVWSRHLMEMLWPALRRSARLYRLCRQPCKVKYLHQGPQDTYSQDRNECLLYIVSHSIQCYFIMMILVHILRIS